MSRIALLSSEPIRPRMAGIGIRYLEFARRLAAAGLETVLLSPATPEESAGLALPGVELRRCEPSRLAEQLRGCSAAVAQGQLANDLVLTAPDLPAAVDLYDPWLIENLSYLATLGLDPYRNDHASWLLQLARGDFFLCSSEEQRIFYLGFLAAVGRVNPQLATRDPDLRSLIDVVPFVVPEVLPPHRPHLPPRLPGERRLLFGGLYDWYDPWTLLEALTLVDQADRGSLGAGWVLLLIRNPNPGTPQHLFGDVEAWCRRRDWWGSRVRALDWVPVERRFDLLRDVDLLVAPHHPSLETRLSLRTRFLDALAAGCPVVTTEGGAMSRLLREHGAGWVVPPGDAPALARAIIEALAAKPSAAEDAAPPAVVDTAPPSALDQAPPSSAWQQGAVALLAAYRWERALAPLLRFCREPRCELTKERFVHPLVSATPPDSAGFRLRRRLRRLWRRVAARSLPSRPARGPRLPATDPGRPRR
ncbi:MAG TPA: glycosyltransferase family 4 protein [Thermoanaerobaculia bacterium]|nr:glycosyltransferase family 4 protein [Thermoanaerobaculia bacterium]